MNKNLETSLISIGIIILVAAMVVGMVFLIRSMPPSFYSRCAAVFPDALTISADSGRAGAVECTMTLADTSEVVVWLDSEGVVLR